MAWILTHHAPKGLRTNRNFWAVTAMGSKRLWYCGELDKWLEGETIPEGFSHSTHDHGPKTTKAFLRYLKKHHELRGSEVVFVNNNYYDFKGKKVSLSITAQWDEKVEGAAL